MSEPIEIAASVPVVLVPRSPADSLRWLADRLDAGENPQGVAISLHIVAGNLGVPCTEDAGSLTAKAREDDA